MIYYETTITARIYKWFYDVKRPPDDFCKYARNVLFMYIMLIPYVLFCWPGFILRLFSEDRDLAYGPTFFISVVMYILMGVVFLLLAFPVLLCINGWMFDNEGFWGAVFASGLVFWISIIVALIISAIIKLNQTVTVGMPSSTILGDFIKAKKNKYCPRIQWRSSR